MPLSLAGLFLLLVVGAAHAQPAPRCLLLCAPELSVEPTITVAPLSSGTRVRELRTGTVAELEPEAGLELILALGIPTTLPRIGLTVEAIWAPFATTGANPFTGYSADETGEEFRDDAVELEFELNIDLLEDAWTGGWLGAHFDVVDKFSPAESPRAGGLYTHKLDLELDVAVRPFRWLPPERWMHRVEVEGSLDYLVTGRPRRGDEVPRGELLYLDDADPWSFSVLLVLPLAPLRSPE